MARNFSKSFTLLETLVSILLILIIALVFFTSFTIAFDYLRRIMELRTATLILQEEVSKVRELKFTDIQSLGGTFTSSSMDSLKNAAGAIKKSNYDGHDEILKMTFKLDWTSFDSKAKEMSLVTLMTDHGINKK